MTQKKRLAFFCQNEDIGAFVPGARHSGGSVAGEAVRRGRAEQHCWEAGGHMLPCRQASRHPSRRPLSQAESPEGSLSSAKPCKRAHAGRGGGAPMLTRHCWISRWLGTAAAV